MRINTFSVSKRSGRVRVNGIHKLLQFRGTLHFLNQYTVQKQQAASVSASISHTCRSENRGTHSPAQTMRSISPCVAFVSCIPASTSILTNISPDTFRQLKQVIALDD
jgi:hypothetical protein